MFFIDTIQYRSKWIINLAVIRHTTLFSKDVKAGVCVRVPNDKHFLVNIELIIGFLFSTFPSRLQCDCL